MLIAQNNLPAYMRTLKTLEKILSTACWEHSSETMQSYEVQT